jgi:hypothetical protein
MALSIGTNQARTDFASTLLDLEVIQKHLTRPPTCRELARAALGISFTTMMLTTLSCRSLFFVR